MTKTISSPPESWVLAENLPTEELVKQIRAVRRDGYLDRHSLVDDAIDQAGHDYAEKILEEALVRLSKINALVKSIDLTQCAPLPWKSKLSLYPITDTGDYDSSCDAMDVTGQAVVVKMDGPGYREVEKEDGDHDADILAICDSVNAVSEIKKILNPHKRG